MGLLADFVEELDQATDIRKVYIMEFRFKTGDSYKTLYKVGIAKDPLDRMLQVARSFFQSRRYVPECRLVKHRKTGEFFRIERALHNKFEDNNFKFKKKFDGSTEFFDIDIDELTEAYEEILPLVKKGVTFEYRLPDWAYSKKELEAMQADSIDYNENGFVRE